MKRRSFIALAAALAVAACAPPLLEAEMAGTLQVVEVQVDVSQIEGVKGREITVPKDQIQRDIRANVLSQLEKGSAGSRPVNAQLSVTSVRLVSPGQALVIGGTSAIRGVLQVTDAKTGEIVLEPTKVAGTAKGGYPLGGIIGAAVKAGITPEQDYRATVAGFAADVRKRLLGAEK